MGEFDVPLTSCTRWHRVSSISTLLALSTATCAARISWWLMVAPDGKVTLRPLTYCFDHKNLHFFRLLDDKSAATGGVHVSPSVRWLAPECVAGQVPAPASDVYAFGMTIDEAVTGTEPFAGVEDASVIETKTMQVEASRSYSAGSSPNSTSVALNGDALDREVWSLIQDMTHVNPIMRPSMQIVVMSLCGLQLMAAAPTKTVALAPVVRDTISGAHPSVLAATGTKPSIQATTASQPPSQMPRNEPHCRAGEPGSRPRRCH